MSTKKIKQVLKFIETDLEMNLNFLLLNQPSSNKKSMAESNAFRICHSKKHRTKAVVCQDFYKKIF